MGDRDDQACQAAAQVLQLCRALAGGDPQGCLPEVANALTNLGLLQRDAGRPALAIAALAEALEIRRGLAGA
ncbi:MAG: tetratricopeptide repeat protein, partial [Phycisphaerales bacterium]